MKSFDSIENSIKERLDPERRTIGESQLREHDQKKQKFPASKILRIEFSASVPEEIKSFLNKRLPEILDFPEYFGMKIQTSGHLIRFVDKTSYETEVGSPLPKNVSLPASRIKYINTSKSFKVMIIIPEKLETAEAIINISRNLFSKLYGNIFLNEKILQMEFYRQSLNGEQKITAAVTEILDLASELNLPSKTFNNYCEKHAKSYRLTMEKKGNKIRRQLTEEWREKWHENKLTSEEKHTIDSMFAEFKESMRTNPEKILNFMVESVKKLNTQLHCILPHERFEYENFEKNHITHYMRSVLNKLEEISSLIGFIEELHSELDNLPENTDLNGISTQIRFRMQQLRKEKKVIEFYVNEISRDQKMESLRKKFPLVLIKMIPKGTPLKDWSKTVKRMEKNYSVSIYSKIYLALHYLSELAIKGINSKEDNIKTSEAGQKLNKLLSTLKYSTKGNKATQSMLGILIELNEKSIPDPDKNAFKRRLLFPLDEFKTAWSYFIASVLTLIYYKKSDNCADLPQGFNEDNYIKSILGYVDKQCYRGINHFHIVKLLWLIYDEKHDSGSLTFMLFCLQNPQEILRFIIHQVMRPQSANSSLEKRLEKLPKYAKVWIKAYQNRLDETID